MPACFLCGRGRPPEQVCPVCAQQVLRGLRLLFEHRERARERVFPALRGLVFFGAPRTVAEHLQYVHRLRWLFFATALFLAVVGILVSAPALLRFLQPRLHPGAAAALLALVVSLGLGLGIFVGREVQRGLSRQFKQVAADRASWLWVFWGFLWQAFSDVRIVAAAFGPVLLMWGLQLCARWFPDALPAQPTVVTLVVLMTMQVWMLVGMHYGFARATGWTRPCLAALERQPA